MWGNRQLQMRVTSTEILILDLIHVWYHVEGLYLYAIAFGALKVIVETARLYS